MRIARHDIAGEYDRMKRYLLFAGWFAGVVAVSAAVWVFAMTQNLRELERRGQSDLALASDRLVSSLFGFRQLAVALAADPRIAANSGADDLRSVLLHASDISGALDFVLLDREGHYIASATGRDSYAWKQATFVQRATDGTLGHHVAGSASFGRRAFYYAAPVFSGGGSVSRVVVAVINLEAIEDDFRGSRPAVFMTDQDGIILFSNRSELIFRDRNLSHQNGTGTTGDHVILPFVDARPRGVLGYDTWSVSGGPYLPRRALHVTKNLPVISMRAEALVDLRPALWDAILQAAASGVVFLLFGSVMLAIANQRRVLAEANTALEERVGERTRELRQANASLVTEVAERKEAEAALQRAQKDLIQAGKLSALGKMSAGISHELNQPLMAIQSFSDNAVTFIERGDTDTAGRNMRKVGDLATRMGRIIQNFRAFARQEQDTAQRVDLLQAVNGAIELASSRLERANVKLQLELPTNPVWVQGGEVRLQQVILNLVTNAIDAMARSDPRELTISVQTDTSTILTIRDTGPGIDEPEKVFEPFYSTKEIGEAEGVGLGLSISYGLVQSFGGNIRGQNLADGGAMFLVELQPWPEEASA